MSAPPPRSRDRPWVHALLFALTLGSTFGTFYVTFGADPAGALQFSLALVTILGAHEMGHYALARYHGVSTTLPFFIPAPLLGVGTLGAVIRLRDPIPDRNALVDIGAAGPLAGLGVAVPVLWAGLSRSHVAPGPPHSDGFPGPWSLWSLVPEWWAAATGPPGPALPDGGGHFTMVFGDSLLLKGLERLVVGVVPPGHEVYSHPLLIAGWFGTLVTMLNLIPIGQLDGGHLTHALFGTRAVWLGRLMALGLLWLALFHSAGWVLWLLLSTFVVGFGHPPVLAPEAPLTPLRRWVCAACALALVLCLMPVPLTQVFAP